MEHGQDGMDALKEVGKLFLCNNQEEVNKVIGKMAVSLKDNYMFKEAKKKIGELTKDKSLEEIIVMSMLGLGPLQKHLDKITQGLIGVMSNLAIVEELNGRKKNENTKRSTGSESKASA